MKKRWTGATTVAICALACLLAGANTDDREGPQDPQGRVRVPDRAAVDAYILGPTSLVAGSAASYRVAVHWASAPDRTGPLPGAEVRLGLIRKGAGKPGTIELARGRTDRAGDAQMSFSVPRLSPAPYTLKLAIASPQGRTTREQEVRIIPGGQILLTTDKKLYQPAQTIHIRALGLRSIDLLPVARRELLIRVKDPKGNIVFEHQARTSRFGVASTDFRLAEEINLGPYSIEASEAGAGRGAVATRQVKVQRYVLPKFKVRVETERAYYRPGDTVRGTVRCDYFFGKPVAGARLSLDARSRLYGSVTQHGVPVRRTDDRGRATFELTLPPAESYPSSTTGEVRVLATVTDTANHLEKGDLSVPLTDRPLTLSAVPENLALVPGVRNRLHVVAGYPDGSPARGALVKLVLSATRVLRRRTDDLGVATFSFVPKGGDRRCNSRGGGMALPLLAQDRLGQRGGLGACVPVAQPGAVLVSPARSMVGPGEVVELTLRAAPAQGLADGGSEVFLDVVKAGQTLATHRRRLARGRATLAFQPDPTLFGLLELRGYRLTSSGERVGTSRMVYVEHPGRLKITAAPDRAVYRPGGRARVRFSVTDSRTGEGVEAALGLLAVDEALVALGGLPEGRSPKLFFTLASQLSSSKQTPRRPSVDPGGRSLGHWVMAESEAQDTRTRAADVLLAAVSPPDAPIWETNPWKERREAWTQLAPRLIQVARAYMADHSVGQRTDKGWRFHPELVPRMAAAGVIERGDVEDPWRRVVRPWHLRATDRSFTFAPLARQLAPRKLARIYDALAESWKMLQLPRERMKRLKRRQWPLVLPQDLLARLVRDGKLKANEIIDPWGKAYSVLRNPRLFINPYSSGLVSRYHISSAGPDGRFGTKDDLGPPGPRVSVAVFGPDSALGSDAEHALGALIGNQIGETYGYGGLGLRGTGRGGGGTGEGTIGLGTLGTIGHGGGSMPARVRSNFPETLLWRPEVVTDRQGRASVDVDLADSITSWRLLATGSTATGLLGAASTTLRVFQDFFVDLDLPLALTQGDRISVPVTIYNYLKQPQRVTLRLQREGWFSPAGPLAQTVDLAPSQVAVRYFPIVARGVGRQDLTVHASAVGAAGAAVADAVRRSVQVEPDGVEHATALGGPLRGQVDHELEIPAQAISGTERVLLSIYAGPMSQTITGMEGMLRRPYGCFEQTSSATYPNVLILNYLRRSKQSSPALETRAKEYINEGYQRLIGFEVPGGGFSWFGHAPANKILTAYGLMEFHDMARVHPVDARIIARTQAWLAAAQLSDGSFGPDRAFINEGATNHFNKDSLRITAYIAHALRQTGYRGKALQRALRYVRANVARATDAYTLAVVGNLLAPDGDAAARAALGRLWSQRKPEDKGIFFAGPAATLTYGGGVSGQIETTALAALAFLARPAQEEQPAALGRVIDALVASKDSYGSWHSTQATILSLRALLLQHERSRSQVAGSVQVLVDGRPHRSVKLRGGQDRAHQLDLTALAGAKGRHRVALRFEGVGNLQYQLVGRYWLPRGEPGAGDAQTAGRARGPGRGPGLAIVTSYDRTSVSKGSGVRLDVDVRNRGKARVEMPLVSLALPPGFALRGEDLTELVRRGQVEKVQQVGSRALLYLTRLQAGGRLSFGLALRSKYPLAVQARPSVVYEYYRPENRAESAPTALKVL